MIEVKLCFIIMVHRAYSDPQNLGLCDNRYASRGKLRLTLQIAFRATYSRGTQNVFEWRSAVSILFFYQVQNF